MKKMFGGRGALAPRMSSTARLLARADAVALEASRAPARALVLLLAVGLGLGALGIPLGMLLADDGAAWFREGMPGTWVSFAELAAVAVIARATWLRDGARRWHESFWGLSAVVFALLAVVELAQPTQFAGKWLAEHAGAVAPFGLRDVDATLLIVLLAVVALVLIRRALVLLRHPRVVALLAIGLGFGLASQALDSLLPATTWEFVAEEMLKATAEPFVVAAFLVALASVSRPEEPAVS